jgi:two-component system response regulator AtoC
MSTKRCKDGGSAENLGHLTCTTSLSKQEPLREHREEILPLACDLLQELNRELKKSFTGFTPEAAELLRHYPWPGNIRELKSVIERAMILAPEGDIDAPYLPSEIREFRKEGEAVEQFRAASPPTSQRQYLTLRELEERYIQDVLAATGHNKAQAARILGIHPTSLLRRLKKKGHKQG